MAAKAATAAIPIVFAVAVDPVKAGLAESLRRPGGNMTGVTNLNVEVEPKRLELVHELLPTATTVAVLLNPTSPGLSEATLQSMEPAARALGLQHGFRQGDGVSGIKFMAGIASRIHHDLYGHW